jgi:hypothetical protein
MNRVMRGLAFGVYCRVPMKLAMVVVVSLVLGRVANAQPAIAGEAVPLLPEPAPLDERTALWLSLGGTAASWAMLGVGASMDSGSATQTTLVSVGLVGTLLAPAAGHWYAHSFVTRGTVLRVAGAASAVVGVGMAFGECFLREDCNAGVAGAIIILGAGVFVGGTLDDIISAPFKARRYNERRLQGVTIAPVVQHDSAALLLSGRF